MTISPDAPGGGHSAVWAELNISNNARNAGRQGDNTDRADSAELRL